MGQQSISVFLVFFAALLALVLVLSKFLHDHPQVASVLPEAAMVLAVGMIAGFCIHLIIGDDARQAMSNGANADGDDDAVAVDSDLSALLSFNPDIFFIALLPPIIFNSGLRIGALFFRHIVPICMLAIVGTTVSAISIAFMLRIVVGFGLAGSDNGSYFQPHFSELLAFGALISSTDPVSTLAVFQAKRVDPQLFYLVFGESVLNDALGIVLFEAFAQFVAQQSTAGTIALGFFEFAWNLFIDSFGSLILGVTSGLMVALLFKHIDMRQTKVLEISTYIVLMYIPFLLAEIMHLSGIVTILFTGITANRYVVPNLSPVTQVNADMLFRLLAHLSETSIFLELGLSVFGLIGHWNWQFIGWSLLACLIGRALNVYPIALFFNGLLLRNEDGVGVDIKNITIAGTNRASPPQAEEDGGTEMTTRYDAKATSNSALTQTLDPSSQQDLDDGMVLGNRAVMSFSEQSFMSHSTSTPVRRKDLKIRPKTQHMLWFSGLRGAVAYACVRRFPDGFDHQKEFTMTTMAIVLITVFLFGSSTDMTLGLLDITTGVDENMFMKKHLREPLVASGISRFDETVIKPYVIRDYSAMRGVGYKVKEEEDAANGRHVRFNDLNDSERSDARHNDMKEMTEEHHMEQVRSENEAKVGTLIRQDSLFDYGGN